MNKALLKNDYILSIIKKVSNILSGIISVTIINRYLGPTLKGEYTSIVNIIEILFVFFSWGYVNMYAYEKKKK